MTKRKIFQLEKGTYSKQIKENITIKKRKSFQLEKEYGNQKKGIVPIRKYSNQKKEIIPIRKKNISIRKKENFPIRKRNIQ